MPLLINDNEIQYLNEKILGDFPHKYAAQIIIFLNQVGQTRNQETAAKAKEQEEKEVKEKESKKEATPASQGTPSEEPQDPTTQSGTLGGLTEGLQLGE